VNNLIETGACGFLAFAILIGSLQYHVWRIYRTVKDDLVRGLALGFLAGNVGLLVHSITANTFILIRVMEPYWFIAGMILASVRLQPKPEAAPEAHKDDMPRNVGMLLGKTQGRRVIGGADAT
jgi:hypothetical protein